MTVDKGWLNQGFFDKFFKESIDDVSNFSIMFFNWHFLFLSQGSSFFKAHILPEVYASDFFNSIHHVNTFEWLVDLDLSALVVDWTITLNCLSSVLDNAFCQVHDVLEVSIGLVNFDRSELRVMSGIHPFVTEDTANFIDAFHTTNDKAFQVKLSRNTQYHVNVLSIVVSNEWTSSSTTSFIV